MQACACTCSQLCVWGMCASMCVFVKGRRGLVCVCRGECDRASPSRQAHSPAALYCGKSLVGCLGEAVYPSWPPHGQACGTCFCSLPTWEAHPSQETSLPWSPMVSHGQGLLACLALSRQSLGSSFSTTLAPKAPSPLFSPPAARSLIRVSLPSPEKQPFPAPHQCLRSPSFHLHAHSSFLCLPPTHDLTPARRASTPTAQPKMSPCRSQ